MNERASSVVFLLGAGASVDGGCLTVKQLTDEFPNWAASAALPRRISEIYDWLRKQLSLMPPIAAGTRQIDVELVLEALERIEGRDTDPLAAFVKDAGDVAPVSTGHPISKGSVHVERIRIHQA